MNKHHYFTSQKNGNTCISRCRANNKVVVILAISIFFALMISDARAEQTRAEQTGTKQTRAEQNLYVQTYHAPVTGFFSNSHLIHGEKEVLLIDAQFSADEGKNVIKMIEASGKSLTKIIITHAHPDHYYGLETLGVYYNEVVIAANKQTSKEISKSINHWMNNDKIERKYANTVALQEQQMLFAGEIFKFLTLKNGESPANTVIYLPSTRTLFIGDLASNGMHMWLAEGNTTRWLTHLEQVRKLGPIDAIYPGHGPKGDSLLIDKAEKYIKDFQQTVASSPDVNTAITAMIKLYPHYRMREILTGSIMSVMASRNSTQ